MIIDLRYSKKQRGTFEYPRVLESIFTTTLHAQSMKEKIENLDFIPNFALWKTLGKIFASHVFGKGLWSRIHEDLSKLNKETII